MLDSIKLDFIVSQTASDSNRATPTPELSEVERLRKEVEELKKQQAYNTATQLFDEKMKSKLAEVRLQLYQQLDARIAQIYAVADQNKSALNTLNLTPSAYTEALRNITSETSALVNSVTIATDGAYARARRNSDTARQTFISQGIPSVDQEYIACLNR